MSEDNLRVDEAAGPGGHDEIHMPPNSFVPISIALSLGMTFVGFVDQVRGALGPAIWGTGLAWFIGSCVVWYLAARNEYSELPESLDGH